MQRMARPVHLDTDIGDNVDDALALALALASPELDLRSVSVVHGDGATLDRRAAVAETLLHLAGRDGIPVVRAIPPQARDMHIVAIGPLTNVAACLDNASKITVMGGMVHPERFPDHWRTQNRGGAHLDTNTRTDPQAALRVAESSATLTWVPIEITLHTQLTTHSLARLQAAETPLCTELARMLQHWSEHGFRHREHGQPDAVANLHDPLALSSLLPQASTWLTVEEVHLRYAIDGELFRITPDATSPHTAHVATRVDAPAFERFYVERILAAFG